MNLDLRLIQYRARKTQADSSIAGEFPRLNIRKGSNEIRSSRRSYHSTHRSEHYRCHQVKVKLVKESFSDQKVPSWRGQLWRSSHTPGFPHWSISSEQGEVIVVGDRLVFRQYNTCEDNRRMRLYRAKYPGNPSKTFEVVLIHHIVSESLGNYH